MVPIPKDISFNYYPNKKKDKDVLANMSLVIGNFIIRGFTIRRSKFDDGLYVSPPHKKLSGGGWSKLIWTSKENWKAIEQKALEGFKNI